MRITLKMTDKYVIDRDKYQFTLVRLSEAKNEDGSNKLDEEGEKIINEYIDGYYGTLDRVLQALADRLIQDSTSVIELGDYVKRYRTIIESLRKEVKA